MTEIKAGPELDRAVTKAIGAEMSILGDVCVDESFFRLGPWFPSTDLNAAFAAAEKVELFRADICLSKGSGGQWIVWDDFDGSDVGSGDTLALAVCAAILKLKG